MPRSPYSARLCQQLVCIRRRLKGNTLSFMVEPVKTGMGVYFDRIPKMYIRDERRIEGDDEYN